MPVADKYRPVDPTPTTLSAPGAVLTGAWVLAILVSLASPATLQTEATYGGWSTPVQGLLRTTASIARVAPFAALRDALDARIDPFDRTTRWFETPSEPADEGDDGPTTTALPTDDRTPGERWAATRPAAPRKVLIVGASSIQYAIGTELERRMADHLDVQIRRKGKVSTGLTRPDVFDWPAEVERLVAEFKPDVVVGQFGGNDGQNIVDDDGGIHAVYTDGWAAEYTRRVQRLTRIVEDTGADLILLGMPVMRSDTFTKKIRWLNDVTRDAVTAVGGTYIDTFDLAADARGGYRADVTVEGSSGRMRMDDGIHFTRLGGRHMAVGLMNALLLEHPYKRLAPPDPIDTDDVVPPRPARLVQRTLPDPPTGSRGILRAYVPEPVPDQGLPLVLLLHGAWDAPRGFVDHLDASLADLATELGVVIAMPDGGPHGWWLDGEAPDDPQHLRWLRHTAVPSLLQQLPIDPAAPRAVVGISMGGHGAFALALEEPERWQAVTALSPVTDLRHAADQDHLVPRLGPIETAPGAWASRSALSRLAQDPQALGSAALWIGIGEDDRHHDDALALHTVLSQAGVAHTWRPRSGGHDWTLWSAMLPAALRDTVAALTRPAAPTQTAGNPPDAATP